MARLSHGLLGALNLVTLLLSLPVLCAGVFFLTRATTECERALQIPVVAFGCALLLLSLVGLAGACGRRDAAAPFLWVYVVFMFLIVVAVFAFTVFAFVVTNRGSGSAVSGRGYREYRLGDYAGWLQARIAEPETWRQVESCLSQARVCGGRLRGAVGQDAMEFYRQHLSPIQSGCCKPPTWCRFRYVNATFWEAPRSGSLSPAAARDGDCRAWSNDRHVLCFECDACKAGVLETVKKKWKTVAIVNVSLLAFLIVVYTIGCCALRSKGGSRYLNGGGPDQT
ncbi:unnamed protein product [Miscanthus lutarioriparius]|uniref:Senescence-associated protein n=1 Tax=Miscanthus lutarioriparius TaxID=422564 RepID=A0A811S672_9POAL|nr:unnamed protein product [Miscanthus lutarioriparius]